MPTISTLDGQRLVVRQCAHHRPGARRSRSSVVLTVVGVRRVLRVDLASATSRSRSATWCRPSSGYGRPDSDFIVRQLRLPRALTAVLVGAAFGLSGAIFQTLARNPLASPDIIGITAGASAVGGVHDHRARRQRRTSCRVGALVGALVDRRWRSTCSPTSAGCRRTGSCSSASASRPMLTAVTSYLLTRAEIYDAQRATVWLTGIAQRPRLGPRPPGRRRRWLCSFPAVLLLGPRRCARCSSATTPRRASASRSSASRAALILVARRAGRGRHGGGRPDRVRRLRRRPDRPPARHAPLTLVPAALVGALLVLLVRPRRPAGASRPTELPVGVVTGIVGAPYLLWLLARANKVGRGG